MRKEHSSSRFCIQAGALSALLCPRCLACSPTFGTPLPQAAPYQPTSESLEPDFEETAAAGKLASAVPSAAIERAGASSGDSSGGSSSSEEEGAEEAVGVCQGAEQQGPKGLQGSAASLEVEGTRPHAAVLKGSSSGQLPATMVVAAETGGMAAACEPADGQPAAEEPGAKRQRMLAEPIAA